MKFWEIHVDRLLTREEVIKFWKAIEFVSGQRTCYSQVMTLYVAEVYAPPRAL